MLLELHIKNFAIIDNINISFSKGFNVFTGETGAGKSIIIDAVNTVLGGRANKEYIRTGQEKAVIEALFYLENPEEIEEILNELGIEREEDNTLLICREIFNSGRSIARVNGRTVTLSMLNKLTAKLVDIHGQHEHQSLLSYENHIKLIDLFGKEKINDLKNKISMYYRELVLMKKRLDELSGNDMERERKVDLLKFQLNEIDSASLKIDEEERLMEEYRILANAQEILTTIEGINDRIKTTNYNQESIIDQLSSIGRQLHSIAKHDSKLNSYSEIIDSIIYQLQDIVLELRDYNDNINCDNEKLAMIEERIELINRLKRKYGNSIKEILEYREKVAGELELIINSEEEVENLKLKIKDVELKLKNLSEILSNERKRISNLIEKNITDELSEMNLKNVSFKIKFTKLDYFTKNGFDRIEFLISTNPGEPLKPLSRIASGGEMSRIMLAFKNILAEVDNIPCLIFDEIDTGISGRTAQIVGEKIAKIARTHQVLCITHLPQIASMASTHFLIEKEVKDDKTYTKVSKLDFNQRVDELSRLLGGVSLTDTTKMHAMEMLEMTKKHRVG
jgi:DNA repair protein RecN (Recombination protein N)